MGVGLLLLRADGGAGIGNGHVMRCVALAEAWLARGGEVTLATAQLGPELRAAVLRSGIQVHDVVSGSAPLAALVTAQRPSWTVIDGYEMGEDHHRAARDAGARVAVIDDHARVGCYDADLIVDQNLGVTTRDYETSLGGGATKVLAGTEFVLLRRRFLQFEPRAVAPEVSRILVSLGGSPPEAAVDLVRSVARDLAIEDRSTFLVGGARVQDMASLLRETDLAITAAGTTVWELCFFGVPMVLLPIADNQVPVAEAMARRGAAVAVPAGVDRRELAGAAGELLQDAALRNRLSATARSLVDGRGASRVVAALRAFDVVLRRADRSDAQLLFDWANDPDTRSGSFNSAPIAWEEHLVWLEARLADPDARILMARDDVGFVGQFRAQRQGRVATVGIVVAPDRRGLGLGSSLVVAGSDRLLDEGWADVLDAWVKPANFASQRAFLDAGYRPVATPRTVTDRLHYALRRPT